MPITNSGSPTTPPVTPMTQPNQIQGNLYPFSAFSADNPNLVSAPMLTLKSPWRFSAPGVVGPLSAAPSANVIYTLPLTYPATHKIYIPAAYLVAASGGPYTLTIKTAAGASVVYVPIIKSGDTLLSGDLMFDVYVDASGNVTSSAWEIFASNATNGWYIQNSNGLVSESQYSSTQIAINTSFGNAYGHTFGAWTYPLYLTAIKNVTVFPYNTVGYICWGASDYESLVSVDIYIMSSASAASSGWSARVEGRWR